MVPLVGFKSTSVSYERHERIAGESHYPLKKMLGLAFDGITSLSVKPIRMVFFAGLFITILSFIGIIWAVIAAIAGHSVGVAGLSGMLRWRDAVPVSRYHRGIHRQNLLGSQAASAVYYFGTHSGDG